MRYKWCYPGSAGSTGPEVLRPDPGRAVYLLLEQGEKLWSCLTVGYLYNFLWRIPCGLFSCLIKMCPQLQEIHHFLQARFHGPWASVPNLCSKL